MDLRKGRVLRVAGRPGAVLRVERGEVWLTQYPDPADYFLGSGQSMRLARPGAAVVSALKDSDLRLVAPLN